MTERIRRDIEAERARQRQLHPETGDHDLFVMLSVIGEEMGKCHRAALEHLSAARKSDALAQRETALHLRVELVQLAATAVKALALFDRGLLAVHHDQFPDDTTQPSNPS